MAMKTFLKSILGIIVRRCQDFIPSMAIVMQTSRAATKVRYFRSWFWRKQFCCFGEKHCAVQFHFTSTAKFSWVNWKATSSNSAKTFLIDRRIKRPTATKDQIYLMDWVIYQSAFSVRMSDDYFLPLQHPSISSISFFQINRLLPRSRIFSIAPGISLKDLKDSFPIKRNMKVTQSLSLLWVFHWISEQRHSRMLLRGIFHSSKRTSQSSPTWSFLCFGFQFPYEKYSLILLLFKYWLFLQ